MSEPVLKVHDFTVEFWVDGIWYPAAVNMNFEVNPGQVLAIVGESGSGKSTTAMGLMTLLASNARMSGSVKVKGQEMLGAKGSTLRKFRGKEVAYIFQEPMTALNPVYTIGFQIIETLRTHFDMGPKEARARALELITMVEIPDPATSIDKYPHQLSGGQRQRAMIAQALACDPGLLVADEPTTALDVTVQAEVLDLMRNLKDKLNSAILLITHDMGVVADMADEILVMKDGLTVEHGSADQIFNRPQHPYTQQLLAAVPKLGSTARRTLPYNESAKPAPVLRLENVTVAYPKRGRIPEFVAAKNVSLEIYPGEILGLVGESGSGKTTIGRAAIGLIPIKEGKLEIVGKDISHAKPKELSAIRRHTGIVFGQRADHRKVKQALGIRLGLAGPRQQLRQASANDSDGQLSLGTTVQGRDERGKLRLGHILQLVNEHDYGGIGAVRGQTDLLQQHSQVALQIAVVGQAWLGLKVKPHLDVAELDLERFGKTRQGAQSANSEVFG